MISILVAMNPNQDARLNSFISQELSQNFRNIHIPEYLSIVKKDDRQLNMCSFGQSGRISVKGDYSIQVFAVYLGLFEKNAGVIVFAEVFRH